VLEELLRLRAQRRASSQHARHARTAAADDQITLHLPDGTPRRREVVAGVRAPTSTRRPAMLVVTAWLRTPAQARLCRHTMVFMFTVTLVALVQLVCATVRSRCRRHRDVLLALAVVLLVERSHGEPTRPHRRVRRAALQR